MTLAIRNPKKHASKFARSCRLFSALLERQRAETATTVRRLGKITPDVFHRDAAPIPVSYGA